MKRYLLVLSLLPFFAHAEKFVISEHNETTVDVSKHDELLEVTCRFPARTKFEPAVNSKLNDLKSERIFLEGLIRYFKASTNGMMVVSGKHILSVKKEGDLISYTFAVPEQGCKIVPRPVPKTTKTNQVMSAQCTRAMSMALSLLSNTNNVIKVNADNVLKTCTNDVLKTKNEGIVK